jgi:hypothetical protein
MSTEVQFPTESHVKVIIELSDMTDRPNIGLVSSPVIEQAAEWLVESMAVHVIMCEVRLVDVWHLMY